MTRFFKLVLHGGIICLLLAAHITAQTEETATMEKHDPDAGPKRQTNRGMTTVISIVISVFFLIGLSFLFYRLCTSFLNRRRGGSLPLPSLGLSPAVVKTFPTFPYSEVKNHKIGQATLECAVCLLEFKDDDILRLLPECCHVFHPSCIDAWLANHDTCPICRINLAPKTGELTPVHRDSGDNINESNSLLKNGVSGSGQVTNHLVIDVNNTATLPELISQANVNQPPRSTLRLPEDVRSQLMKRSSYDGNEELQQLR